ncbi:MAG: N10-methylenetetrahydromethanopterin reductase-related protein [Ilumatobacteraceae bacterium]|nr:N10-methylenetetrahydromethanopterin reductase-related protein [Ilumatobacteraceae bacterium]
MPTLALGANLSSRSGDGVRKQARLAEDLGFDSVWAGEAYGTDAVTPLTWAAACTERLRIGSAIMQIPARSPASAAMTALTLDRLSGGRFRLGLGTSGPQVVEGWHGQPFRKPLATTAEYVDIVRQIFAADGKIELDGSVYQLPYRGPGATGDGKALRSAFKPATIPILLAAIGPKNVELAMRIGDGLLPMLWNPHRAGLVYSDVIAKAASGPFEVVPTVPIAVGDDIAACRDKVRPMLTAYIGGMGSRERNFYNRLIRRYGYEETADVVQDLYLDGRRDEAAAAVPDALIDELALVGPARHIAEQLTAWQTSGITTLILAGANSHDMRTVAELVL